MISPLKVFKSLVAVIIVLLTANIITLFLSSKFDGFFVAVLFKIFNFDEEVNIPSIYSTGTLLFCAFLLLFIWLNIRWKAYKFKWHWFLLSLLFFFLSLDELASIHEMSIGAVREYFDFSGFLFYSWVIPYGIFTVVFAIVYIPFLLKLSRITRIYFAISFTLFISGAAGMELLGGRQHELYGQSNYFYAFLYTVEEFLEMLGIAFFSYTLLLYIAQHLRTNTIQLEVEPTSYPKKVISKSLKESGKVIEI